MRGRIRGLVSRRDRLETKSRQVRATTPGSHCRACARPGLAGGARSTAPGPDLVDFDLCLGALRIWPSNQVECRRPTAGDRSRLRRSQNRWRPRWLRGRRECLPSCNTTDSPTPGVTTTGEQDHVVVNVSPCPPSCSLRTSPIVPSSRATPLASSPPPTCSGTSPPGTAPPTYVDACATTPRRPCSFSMRKSALRCVMVASANV